MSDVVQRSGRGLVVLALVVAPLGCGEPATLPDPDPEVPGYELLVRGGTDRSAERMEVLELVIDVERQEEGYEGPVTFTSDAPEGIVVIFRPTTVLNSNSTDVLVVADGSVVPKLHQIAIHGTAPDRPDRVVILNFTVTP